MALALQADDKDTAKYATLPLNTPGLKFAELARTVKFRRYGIAVVAVFSLAACGGSSEQKEAAFLKRGRELAAQKDYARALLEFKNAASARPEDAEPYYQMGLTALATGDLGGAARAFQRAATLNRNHAGAQLKVSELMTATHDPKLTEEAEKRLEQLLTSLPDNPEIIDSLAIAEYQLGKPTDAINRLQDALKKFPAHLASAVVLAKWKLQNGDVEGAEIVLKNAVASAPNSADAAGALGQFYLARHKPELAEPHLRRALELDPKNPGALLALAAILVRSHRMIEAEGTYKKISQLPDQRYRAVHAIFLFQQNQREAALAELKTLAKKNPEDRPTRSRLVALYALMNRVPEAERELNAALERHSNDQDALWQRVQLYLATGRIREAENDLHQILRFRPEWPEAHFALARAHGLKRETWNERQELLEAIRLDPGLMPARLLLASSYTASGDAKSALRVLDEAPEPQQGNVDFLIARNWALLLTGNFREARAYLDTVLKLHRMPEAILQDAVIKFSSQDYSGTREDAEEILREDPENVKAAYLLADIYVSQKQLPMAVDRIRQLLSQRPNSVPLEILLAKLLASGNDLVQARAMFEEAEVSEPRSADVNLAIAGLDVLENRLSDARQKLAEIVARDPTNVRALLLLAELMVPKDETAAIALYRSALAVDDSNVVGLNNLAYLLAKHNPDEAMKFAQQAVELAPGNADAQDTLGWVYYRKGLYRNALPHLKAALKQAPSPVRQFHLGMAYVKTGEESLGHEMVQSAVRRDPNLTKAETDW